MDFTSLFVDVDDFWQQFRPTYEQKLLADGTRKRRREPSLNMSEMMTILISFQSSNYRDFKHFYLFLYSHHQQDFPKLVKYHRFIELLPRTTIPLFAYLMTQCIGQVTGISFIDSTSLKVCSNKRITRNRVFDGLAEIGKTTIGWFYGFKLHLVINECGELLAFTLTPGNVDDRKPVPQLSKDLWGKLFGDKGYVSQKLFQQLLEQGTKLITNVRKNMKNKLLEFEDKILLRKRSLIETVNDQLKNVCQIEHSRHRSPGNFMTHLIAGLISYAKKEKKPSLRFSNSEKGALHALA